MSPINQLRVNVLIRCCPLPLQQVLDCPLRSDPASQHLVPLPIGQPTSNTKIRGNGWVEMGWVRGNLRRVRKEMGGIGHMGVDHRILIIKQNRRLCHLSLTGPLAVSVTRQLPLPASHPSPRHRKTIKMKNSWKKVHLQLQARAFLI